MTPYCFSGVTSTPRGMCSSAVWAPTNHVHILVDASGFAGVTSPHGRRFSLEFVMDTGTLVTWIYSCNSRTFRTACSLATGDSDSAGLEDDGINGL